MTTFFLVRHALTDAIDNYLSGTAAGTPVNRAGRPQIDRLVDIFRDLPLAAVVSSPLTRTRETADPIARSHGLEVQEMPAFLEFEVGRWTGRSFRELDDDPEWPRFNAVRSLVRPPGGELMIEVQQRAVAALLDLSTRYVTGNVVVVSHGDVIRAMLMYFLGMPVDFVHRIDVLPGSISVVTLDKWMPVVRLVNGDSARFID